MVDTPNLEFYPLTAEKWSDLERLFGEHGACGGCWCMSWRLKRSDFIKQKGDGNRKALKKIVKSGQVPGILAYSKDEPIGWCSVAPRESFPALERSRILKRVDSKDVWSVVCFFVAKPHRCKGVSVKLLQAAIDYVKKQNGKIVEGYPTNPRDHKTPDAFVYTGLESAFHKAGFIEAVRRSKTRPVMRYIIQEK